MSKPGSMRVTTAKTLIGGRVKKKGTVKNAMPGGQKEQGLAMLRRSLEIGRKAGFPDVGVVEERIEKIEG